MTVLVRPGCRSSRLPSTPATCDPNSAEGILPDALGPTTRVESDEAAMAPLESSRQASILRCGCDEMERPGARVRFYTGPWSSTFIIIPILTKEFASFDDEEAGRQEGSQTATQVKAGLPAAPYREQTVAACALLAHNNTAPKFVNNLCPTPEFLSSARFPFPGDSEACVWLVERAENLDRHLMQTVCADY